ncbi:hypothetical protein [Methanosarcina mazei]|uniref:Uncharacterized protein n=1 Tax=Methanosarcina mazei TaxID=2209 RepID=A0A0F8KG97_METMZ|nr:hypothetical protein [Methanosarcina mazei]KKG79805.1 hypothetical protein DU55_13095 [Methanosarcina mazei]
MENKSIDDELNEIFSKEVEIQIAPTLHKKSQLKTGTKIKISLIIYLSEPSDQKDIFEVTDLKYISNQSSCITVKGLSETLEIGSWIRKSELKDLKRQNKDIKFIGGE